MTEKKKSNKKKNVVFESLDFDLNKGTDLTAGEAAVGKAEEFVPVEKTAVKKAKPKEELIRTTIDFPKSEHRQLKILAMNADKKLYQYLYDIIKQHLEEQHD